MTACQVCAGPGIRLHHPTGRNPDGDYLDPALTVELCHTHHMLCHDDWHTFELETVEGPLTVVELAALGMRRLALTLARIDGGMDAFWGRLASSLVDWAVRLEGFVTLLDDRVPEWRAHLVSGDDAM